MLLLATGPGLGGLGGVAVPGNDPFLLEFSNECVPLIDAPSRVNGEGEGGALPGPGELSSPSCWPSVGVVVVGVCCLFLDLPVSVFSNVPRLASGGFRSNLNFLG